MADFNLFSPFLLEAEGGYQNSPNDTGNFNSLGQNVGTNKGISAKTYEAWIGHPPTISEMQAITTATALAIYKQNYWDAIGADFITSQNNANIICDHLVNAGGSAGKIAQTICNLMGKTLIVDGAIGPNTRAAINSVEEATFYNSYKQARKYYYDYLCGKLPVSNDFYDLFKSWGYKENPARYSIFHTGWINRVNEFPDLPGGSVLNLETANPILINSEAKKKFK